MAEKTKKKTTSKKALTQPKGEFLRVEWETNAGRRALPWQPASTLADAEEHVRYLNRECGAGSHEIVWASPKESASIRAQRQSLAQKLGS